MSDAPPPPLPPPPPRPDAPAAVPAAGPPPPPPSGAPAPPPPGAAFPVGSGPVTAGGPRRSGRAIASLVLGIAGLVLCFLVVPAILAIVFGVLARKDIDRQAGRLTGRGMATAGIVLGVVGVLAGAGFYVAAALGDFDDLDDDDSVTAGFDVGDCVEVPEGDFFFRLRSQDCADPHEGEVYFVSELAAAEGEEYPGAAEVQEQIGLTCVREFERYVARPYAESELDFAFIYPTRQQWDDDNRGYLCIAFYPGGDLTESVAGSGR